MNKWSGNVPCMFPTKFSLFKVIPSKTGVARPWFFFGLPPRDRPTYHAMKHALVMVGIKYWIGRLVEDYAHIHRMVVRSTTLVVNRDAESCFQRLQWRPGQSSHPDDLSVSVRASVLSTAVYHFCRFIIQYPNCYGVGVTKAPFVNFSVSKIFDLVKVPLRLFESYL